jgi:hypothetical protein
LNQADQINFSRRPLGPDGGDLQNQACLLIEFGRPASEHEVVGRLKSQT